MAKRVGLRQDGENAGMGKAYQAAKAGGAHQGWYKERLGDGPVQLAKSLRSFAQQADMHQGWLADPASKVPDWELKDARYQRGLLAKWRQDIRRHHEQIDIILGVLKEKESSNG